MILRLDTDSIIQDKITAIKKVYHDWGVILRSALRSMSPVDRGVLRSSIRFRVDSPKSKKDITGTVSLLVGVLDKNSPALKYLKYIVNGSREHFVPIKTIRGKYTGILGWAQRHNLVYFGKDGPKSRNDWRWKDGSLKGQIFRGVKVFLPGNDMFNFVYNRYYRDIQMDIDRIIRDV